MARIGLNNFRYAIASINDSTGAVTYAGAKKPAKAISFNFEPTLSDAELYADDALAEVDHRVTGGTVTMGIDRFDDTAIKDVLGHDVTSDVVTSSNNDEIPYVGLGRITRMMINGEQKFRATFLALVKFSEPSEEDTTMGESIEFNTYELEGTMAIPKSGVWRKYKTLTSMEDAVNWLEGQMAASTARKITYNINGGTGTPEAQYVTAGDSCTLRTGAGLVPPSGKHFAGWATTNSASTPDVSSPYTPAASVTLYAVWVSNS